MIYFGTKPEKTQKVKIKLCTFLISNKYKKCNGVGSIKLRGKIFPQTPIQKPAIILLIHFDVFGLIWLTVGKLIHYLKIH